MKSVLFKKPTNLSFFPKMWSWGYGGISRRLVPTIFGLLILASFTSRAGAWDISFIDSGQSLGSSDSVNVSMGDVDGDGDLDALVANYGANRVWLNDGAGNFTNSGQNLGSASSHGVGLGDVDCDGDLDVFIANFEGQANKVWVNDGAGNFTDSGQSLGDSNGTSVAMADLDSDGDLDAFVTNYDSQANKVWLNDGTGTFTDSGQNLGTSYSQSVKLEDVDGDGDLDAFVANGPVGSNQPNKVWLNDGAGNFTDSGQSLGPNDSGDVAIGDLDGDGDLDAFVANGAGGNQANKVWLNDGFGNFTDSGQSLGSGPSHSVSLADLDGDGDLDAFVTNMNNQANKVWLNDGTGVFSDSGLSLGSSYSIFSALGDLDSDGDLDAFVPNWAQANKVWLNKKPKFTSTFSDSGQSFGNTKGVDVDLGDLDRDGDLDAFVANYQQSNKVWLNNGTGTFSDSGQSLGEGDYTDVYLGDVDGDGDLDAFVTRAASQSNQVWLNDGAGNFTDSGQSLGNVVTNSVMLGDLDRDGDLDAFIGNGSANKVWLNDGNGVFTDSGQSLGSVNTWAFALGDVDRDGDLDAFIPNNGSPCKVWLNDGNGNFTDSGQSLGNLRGGDVGLVDLDGDGDLDAFVANGAAGGNQPNKVWLNDGTGTFTDSGQSLGNSNSGYVAMADLDHDGDIDAFVTNLDQANKVWWNDGTGTFTDSGFNLGSANSWDVTLGDVDRDGDLDAFVTNGALISGGGEADKVWLNNLFDFQASDFDEGGFVDFNDLGILVRYWVDRNYPEQGLVGYWKLDEGTGSIAHDSSGNDNDGNLNGDPNWVAGWIGSYALDFDADGDYVNVPDIDDSLDVDSNITIAAWVRLNSIDAHNFIVTKQPSGTAGNPYPGNYEFKMHAPAGYLRLSHQTTTGENFVYYESTTAVSAGDWNHVAVTLKRLDSVRFYIDGSPAGTTAQTTTFGILNDEPVRIGVRKDMGKWFNGTLDDVCIYNRALSKTEIRQYYSVDINHDGKVNFPDFAIFAKNWLAGIE